MKADVGMGNDVLDNHSNLHVVNDASHSRFPERKKYNSEDLQIMMKKWIAYENCF